MIMDSSISIHIILFRTKLNATGYFYLCGDKQFQYVSPYNLKMTVSVTERKAEARKILPSLATTQRTSGVDTQHRLLLRLTASESLTGLENKRDVTSFVEIVSYFICERKR